MNQLRGDAQGRRQTGANGDASAPRPAIDEAHPPAFRQDRGLLDAVRMAALENFQAKLG